MEIVSIILSIPLLLLICWGLGALFFVLLPDPKQNTGSQILAGIVILILIGLITRL